MKMLYFPLLAISVVTHEVLFVKAHQDPSGLRRVQSFEDKSNANTEDIGKPSLPCILLKAEVMYKDQKEMSEPISCELQDPDLPANVSRIVDIGSSSFSNRTDIEYGVTTIFADGAAIVDVGGRQEFVIPENASVTFGRRTKSRGRSHSNRPWNRRLAVIGTKTVLVIRVVAADFSATLSEAQISSDVFDDAQNLKTMYAACSDGKVNFQKVVNKPGVPANSVITVVLTSNVGGADSGVAVSAVLVKAEADLGVPLRSIADHVMICLPPNTIRNGRSTWFAYAFINHWLSVYNDIRISPVSGQMHELGHNLGLGHANEGNLPYDDKSGLMGFSYLLDDGPLMCFNGPNTYKLGWYSDYHVTINSIEPSWEGNLIGFAEKAAATLQDKMIVRILTSTDDVYVHFNRMVGFNSGTQEGGDQVLVATRPTGIGYAQTDLVAKLSEGKLYCGNGVLVYVRSIVSGIPMRANVLIQPFTGSVCQIPPTPTTQPTIMPTLTPIALPGTPLPTFQPTSLPTQPPTMAPTTLRPTSLSPTTSPPTTLGPTTFTPTTLTPIPFPPTTAPTTLTPTTVSPTTTAPTTLRPTTLPPTTLLPTTLPPTTLRPTTLPPTTLLPTTLPPTTLLPTTLSPTTSRPTTLPPTTLLPTTLPPTTLRPTTIPPTTLRPTTIPPTTLRPTTLPPTTAPTTLSPRLLQEPCVLLRADVQNVGGVEQAGKFQSVQNMGLQIQCELQGQDRTANSPRIVWIPNFLSRFTNGAQLHRFIDGTVFQYGITTIFSNGAYIINSSQELIIPAASTFATLVVGSRNANIKLDRSILVIRVVATNAATTLSETALVAHVFDPSNVWSLKSRFAECSAGQANFQKVTNKIGIPASSVLTVQMNTSLENLTPFKAQNLVQTQAEADLGVPLSSIADHVMICLPPGTNGDWVAYGYINSWLSVYNSDWCSSTSARMHGIGHNLGLDNALRSPWTETDYSKAYHDNSGMMGLSSIDAASPRMCFNGPHTYQLGWYKDYHVTLSTVTDVSGQNWEGNLIGFVEKGVASSHDKMIILVQGPFDMYVHFNRKLDANSGTMESSNEVLVTLQDSRVSPMRANLSIFSMWNPPAARLLRSPCVLLMADVQFVNDNQSIPIVGSGVLTQPVECELQGQDIVINRISPRIVKIPNFSRFTVGGQRRFSANLRPIEYGVTTLYAEGAIIDSVGQELIIPNGATLVVGNIPKNVKPSRSVLIIRVEAPDVSTDIDDAMLNYFVFDDSANPSSLNARFGACSSGQTTFRKLSGFSGVSASSVLTVTLSSNIIGLDVKTVQNMVQAQAEVDLGVTIPAIVDHVIMVLPEGLASGNSLVYAYGYINHWLSVYNAKAISSTTARMHHVGHNLGLEDAVRTLYYDDPLYDDKSGMMMGAQYDGNDTPAMCFNGPNMYQLGWYKDFHVTLPTTVTGQIWEGNLIGFVEKDAASSQDKMVIRIQQGVLDVYVHFNRQLGINSGTLEGGDQVFVSLQDPAGSTPFAAGDTRSLVFFSLSAGQQNSIFQYKIRVNSITSGTPMRANISIFDT